MLLSQATKEAEYREKVADLKLRIDSCGQRVAAEEEQVATAKVRRASSGATHPRQRSCCAWTCTVLSLSSPAHQGLLCSTLALLSPKAQ